MGGRSCFSAQISMCRSRRSRGREHWPIKVAGQLSDFCQGSLPELDLPTSCSSPVLGHNRWSKQGSPAGNRFTLSLPCPDLISRSKCPGDSHENLRPTALEVHRMSQRSQCRHHQRGILNCFVIPINGLQNNMSFSNPQKRPASQPRTLVRLLPAPSISSDDQEATSRFTESRDTLTKRPRIGVPIACNFCRLKKTRVSRPRWPYCLAKTEPCSE